MCRSIRHLKTEFARATVGAAKNLEEAVGNELMAKCVQVHKLVGAFAVDSVQPEQGDASFCGQGSDRREFGILLLRFEKDDSNKGSPR